MSLITTITDSSKKKKPLVNDWGFFILKIFYFSIDIIEKLFYSVKHETKGDKEYDFCETS